MSGALLPLPSMPGPRRLPLAGAAAVEATAAPARTVRISLTDRCDLACVYCRPSRADGYLENKLDDVSWEAMVRALVAAGIRRVRVTGGEPLLHPRVVDRVAFLASMGLEDLALTTNGTRLARLAHRLREAGLRRLTVSLDSLVPERFWRMTRGGRLAPVLEGIDAAREARFEEIKINTVVLRGENDNELAAIVEWAWERGLVPRFIEVMRVGEGARLPPERVLPGDAMRARLAHLLTDEAWATEPDRGPARYVRSRRDPALRVGFITGTTDTYCEGCDRLRVAADGMLRPCLATEAGVAAGDLAAAGDHLGLQRAVAEAWALKPDGRTWKGCTESSAADVSMRATGG